MKRLYLIIALFCVPLQSMAITAIDTNDYLWSVLYKLWSNINDNVATLYLSTNGTRLQGTYQLNDGTNTHFRFIGTNVYIDNTQSLSGYVPKVGDSEIDGKITVLSNLSVGLSSTATKSGALSGGNAAQASGEGAFSYGNATWAAGNYSVAHGYDATAPYEYSMYFRSYGADDHQPEGGQVIFSLTNGFNIYGAFSVFGPAYIDLQYATNLSANTIFSGTTNDYMSGNGTLQAWPTAGSGDFKADGTVPMTGNLDMGGNGISNTTGYAHSHSTNKYNAIPLYGTNFVIPGTNGNRFILYPTNDYQVGFGPEWGTNYDGDCKIIIPSNAYTVVWKPLVSDSYTNIGTATTPQSVIMADHSFGETNWDVYRLK